MSTSSGEERYGNPELLTLSSHPDRQVFWGLFWGLFQGSSSPWSTCPDTLVYREVSWGISGHLSVSEKVWVPCPTRLSLVIPRRKLGKWGKWGLTITWNYWGQFWVPHFPCLPQTWSWDLQVRLWLSGESGVFPAYSKLSP